MNKCVVKCLILRRFPYFHTPKNIESEFLDSQRLGKGRFREARPDGCATWDRSFAKMPTSWAPQRPLRNGEIPQSRGSNGFLLGKKQREPEKVVENVAISFLVPFFCFFFLQVECLSMIHFCGTNLRNLRLPVLVFHA